MEETKQYTIAKQNKYGSLLYTITSLDDGTVLKKELIRLGRKGLTTIHGPFFNNSTVNKLKKDGVAEYVHVGENFKVVYEYKTE